MSRSQAIETVALVTQHNGNVMAASRASGISRPTLDSRYRRALQILSAPPAPHEETIRLRLRIPAPTRRILPPVSSPQISSEAVRVVQIPDAHDSPSLPDKSRFAWIGRYIAEHRPDYIVDIGDSLDLESICFHIQNDTIAGKLKPSFMTDMESYNKAQEALFNTLERKVSGYQPKKKKLDGNHENRIWRWEDANPEVSGMMQVEYESIVARYGWQRAPYGEFVNIAGVDFTHIPLTKMGKPRGGEYAANAMARKAVRDLVTGHTHIAQQRCDVKDGLDERVRVFETGTALPQGYIEKYAEHSATGWWWGINEFLIQNGRIEGWSAVPMSELERRYGGTIHV